MVLSDFLDLIADTPNIIKEIASTINPHSDKVGTAGTGSTITGGPPIAVPKDKRRMIKIC